MENNEKTIFINILYLLTLEGQFYAPTIIIHLQSEKMKKLFVLLVILGVTIPTFAGLKEKDLIGKWNYRVIMDEGTLTGTLMFMLKEGKLAGDVHTDDGEIIPMDNLEIRDNNAVYFEITPEYDVMKILMTVSGKKYEGTIETFDGTIEVTGEKIE